MVSIWQRWKAGFCLWRTFTRKLRRRTWETSLPTTARSRTFTSTLTDEQDLSRSLLRYFYIVFVVFLLKITVIWGSDRSAILARIVGCLTLVSDWAEHSVYDHSRWWPCMPPTHIGALRNESAPGHNPSSVDGNLTLLWHLYWLDDSPPTLLLTAV